MTGIAGFTFLPLNSLDYTLLFELPPGHGVLIIESDGTLASGVGYPAVNTVPEDVVLMLSLLLSNLLMDRALATVKKFCMPHCKSESVYMNALCKHLAYGMQTLLFTESIP